MLRSEEQRDRVRAEFASTVTLMAVMAQAMPSLDATTGAIARKPHSHYSPIRVRAVLGDGSCRKNLQQRSARAGSSLNGVVSSKEFLGVPRKGRPGSGLVLQRRKRTVVVPLAFSEDAPAPEFSKVVDCLLALNSNANP